MRMTPYLFWVVLLIQSFFFIAASFAEDVPPGIDLGEEYTEHSKGGPYRPSSSGSVYRSESSLGRKLLLYLPNRLLDIVDILKADVGLGPSYGAVVRPTKYAQFGVRRVKPFSVRFGLRGRKLPVFIESSDEYQGRNGFVSSREREVSPGEFGLGVDAGIAGVYAGVSLDEVADFILGFLLIDFKNDDFR